MGHFASESASAGDIFAVAKAEELHTGSCLGEITLPPIKFPTPMVGLAVTPNPLGSYAKSKYYGECYVRQSVPKHFVVRAGWMMGGGPRKDKKFVNKIYQQLAAGKRTLHVVGDKLGSPTYTVDFARGIHGLLESELYGLYNQVCGGGGSRYDVAVELVRLLGLERTVAVEKVSSEFFAREYFAMRPASEQLVNTKLDARHLNITRDWRVCLAEYVRCFPPIE